MESYVPRIDWSAVRKQADAHNEMSSHLQHWQKRNAPELWLCYDYNGHTTRLPDKKLSQDCRTRVRDLLAEIRAIVNDDYSQQLRAMDELLVPASPSTPFEAKPPVLTD